MCTFLIEIENKYYFFFNIYLLFALFSEFTTILSWTQILKLCLYKMLFDWVKPIYCLCSKVLKLLFSNNFTENDKGNKSHIPLLFFKEACFAFSSLLICYPNKKYQDKHWKEIRVTAVQNGCNWVFCCCCCLFVLHVWCNIALYLKLFLWKDSSKYTEKQTNYFYGFEGRDWEEEGGLVWEA